MSHGRLPGNRVVKRRLNATQIIPVPKPLVRRDAPTPQAYARRFVAAFTILVCAGTLLLSLPLTTESGESTTIIDALFTAISALAVTGLVVVETQEHWNFFGELVILLLIQIGGLGFTVGASIVLVTLGRGGQLGSALLAQDGAPTLPLSEVLSLSKRIVRFVLVTEAVGALLLTIKFLQHESPFAAIWQGLFHAVSAFCNAGFDLQGGYRSMLGFRDSVWVNLTLIALIQAGTLSFLVLSDAWSRRRWRAMAVDTRVVLLANAFLVAVGTLVFLFVEWNSALGDASTWSKPLTALFQSVSARTAGFATVNLGEAQDPSLFLWIGLMMVGGASGSTAGGVKLTTLAIVIVAIISTLRGHPETQVFNRRIASPQIFLAMGIIALYLFVHFLLTLALAEAESVMGGPDVPFLAFMFETMSAAATVGLSTGITPALSDPGKLILCVAMFFGRLGPLTLVYAITRRQRPARYRYAEVRVRIG